MSATDKSTAAPAAGGEAVIFVDQPLFASYSRASLPGETPRETEERAALEEAVLRHCVYLTLVLVLVTVLRHYADPTLVLVPVSVL